MSGKVVVENNAMLTKQEEQRVDELAQAQEEEKLRYLAAACALRNCSAELADNDPNKEVFQKLEEAGRSDELASYREVLREQDYIYHREFEDEGGDIYPYEEKEPLFQYTGWDEFSDTTKKANNEYALTTRAGGALQLGFGAVEGVLSIGSSPACTTIGGCVIPVGLAISSADNMAAGAATLVNGKQYHTLGALGLSATFDISPENAELIYGLGSGALSIKASQKFALSAIDSSEVSTLLKDFMRNQDGSIPLPEFSFGRNTSVVDDVADASKTSGGAKVQHADNLQSGSGNTLFSKWDADTNGLYSQKVDGKITTVAHPDAGYNTDSLLSVLNKKPDTLNQAGKISYEPFPRTEGLGATASMAELKATAALPSDIGVILTDRSVRFGDLYELATLGGRKVEFSLVREIIDGRSVNVLYSGNSWASPSPIGGRLIAHVHPNETPTQKWPSSADMKILNDRYFEELFFNSQAQPRPSRIIWGPGDLDNTVYYPGFGKAPLEKTSNKKRKKYE